MQSEQMSAKEYQDFLKNKKPAKRSKYNNTIIRKDAEVFHSKKEYHRYLILQDKQNNGIICELKRQVKFELVVDGIKICDYFADFTYRNNHPTDHEMIVEDVKGMRKEKFTDKNGKKKVRSNAAYEIFRLKKNLMLAIRKIKILET